MALKVPRGVGLGSLALACGGGGDGGQRMVLCVETPNLQDEWRLQEVSVFTFEPYKFEV